ncbi:MAG: hypothetical protein HYW48_08650 [Deltaproteobacteria bacterium]|nr:hypothetical protein [Deltaproteobacteria bacterium]
MKPSILFVDLAGYKKIPPLSFLKICASGLEVLSVSNTMSALKVIKNRNDLMILLSNAPDLQLFAEFFRYHPNGKSCLLTDLPMARYSESLGSHEEKYVDHIIANRAPSPWTYNELRISLQKMIRQDLFGIEKYLLPSTEIFIKPIADTVRTELTQGVIAFVQSKKVGTQLPNRAASITEELVMNALYDAPPLSNGSVDPKVELPQNQRSQLSYGFDGSVLAIGVRDPFGSLRKETIFKYLKKALPNTRPKDLIDSKKEGAGLGLYSILYNSHALVCNSDPERATEVIALIDVNYKVRDYRKAAKSIHFFLTSV